MQQYQILWIDDEIDLLKPHIIFLEQKGYHITPVNNGYEGLEMCENELFDLVFLDENMPGMNGLEVLTEIKKKYLKLPVIMITKNEEEYIMEEAIGAKIADYLIKPLNPNQILLAIKKILDNKRLISEKTSMGYQRDFQAISMAFHDDLSADEWVEMYKKLVYWELEIESANSEGMGEVLDSQRTEANTRFCNFIIEHYGDWLQTKENRPTLSHEVFSKWVYPLMRDRPMFWIVIDNLRFDQWKVLETMINELFDIREEKMYFSILPTTTAYARNALFSGLLPSEMERLHPDLWVGEQDDKGKNNHEDAFFSAQLKRLKVDIKHSYHKIKNQHQGKQLADSAQNLLTNNLNILVYNFVDMLSHARTEMQMIRELAPDEPAYRSITKSWLTHSPLYALLSRIASNPVDIIITTDHGTTRVKKPFKIIGDRNTNTNLRYKMGKNLAFDGSGAFEIKNPEIFYLPKPNISTSYVFATESHFFAYPNNYNYYVNYFKDTFQHGGISMEEMIIPFISLTSKVDG